MRDQITRSRGFERRALLLTGGKLALMTALAGRLGYLQLVRSGEYKTLSDDNRIRLQTVLPLRGRILDRNGVELAKSKKHFRVLFDASETENDEAILQVMQEMLGLSEEKMAYIAKKMAKEGRYRAVAIKDHLNWDEVSAIEVAKPDLPGISIEDVHMRHYPLGPTTVHLVGYVGAPAEAEVERNPALAQPDFKVGKSGIELQLEDALRGTVGIKRVEVDAHGLNVRELSIEDSRAGEDTALTIDSRLQNFVAEKIKDQGGIKESGASALVMDLKDGAILAMASAPMFNPNTLIEGVNYEEWEKLVRNPDAPLINKTIGVQYPPGSTFKLIVALAALDAGIISPSTRFYCPGYLEEGGRKFRCWFEDGHGSLSLRRALARSCNVYFYNVAKRVGIERIAAMSRRFGLGSPTGIEIPGEESGLVPDKAWKRKVYNERWHKGETLNAGIGQGYLLMTPLQLLMMGAQVVTHGKRIQPHVIKKPAPLIMPNQPAEMEDVLRETAAEEADRLDIPKQHFDSVIRGMQDVTNYQFGTAFRHRITKRGFEMGGKTGTAQVRASPEHDGPVERRFRNHALFFGYAPIHAPRYAATVVIEHGIGGSITAAPIGRDILFEVQRLAEEDAKAAEDTPEETT